MTKINCVPPISRAQLKMLRKNDFRLQLRFSI